MLQNTQWTVSTAGSTAVKSGGRLTLTLNYTHKPPYGGYRAIWTAAQTLGGEQPSAWRVAGVWRVPGQ